MFLHRVPLCWGYQTQTGKLNNILCVSLLLYASINHFYHSRSHHYQEALNDGKSLISFTFRS